MNKKIFLSLLVFITLFVITGCELSTKNKSYSCEYTKNDSGLQTILKRTIEVNSKGEPVMYIFKYGFSNYGGETDKYKNLCKNLEETTKNEKVVRNLDSVKVTAVCDEKNNYEVYMLAEYDVVKIDGNEDYKAIDKYIKKHTKKDGTFDKDTWKKTFFEDQDKEKYTCDF